MDSFKAQVLAGLFAILPAWNDPLVPVARHSSVAKLEAQVERLNRLHEQHCRVSFSRAAAIAFVESCWELITDNPDVWYWSERFIEAGAVEVPA